MISPSLGISWYKQLNPNELSPAQFQKLEKELQENPFSDTISDESVDYLLWLNNMPSRQELFAKFLTNKLPKDAKVLEVGGGRTYRLSRFLSKTGYMLTCIDPKLDLSVHSNVKLIKERFDYRTADLSLYDYVIAQEPCDATEHIIRACLNQNVPFIISLCGTPHRLISGRMPASVDEWYEYLINIDSSKMRFRNLNICPITTTPILKSNQF